MSVVAPTYDLATERDALARIVDSIAQVNPPLLLLVGAEDRITAVLASLHAATGAPLLALSQELGARLLEQTERQRQRLAVRALRELLAPYRGRLTLLDRTALLFLPELALNPLQLLLDTARVHGPLVAAWAGVWADETLTYAAPGHVEYRNYSRPAAQIQRV
jgi:hypothetical protein